MLLIIICNFKKLDIILYFNHLQKDYYLIY
jgi:hypothetical protein